MPLHSPLPGIDCAAGLRLCGSDEALYLRMLLRFPEDKSFPLLCAALHAHDAPAAFLHAHTLKGLSAQLGLTPLSDLAAAICEPLRGAGAASLPEAMRMLPPLRRAHAQALRSIRRLTA